MRRVLLLAVLALVLLEGCDVGCGRGYQEDAEGVCWPAVDWEITGCRAVECFSGEFAETDFSLSCSWPCVDYEGETGRSVTTEWRSEELCINEPILWPPEITVADGDCG